MIYNNNMYIHIPHIFIMYNLLFKLGYNVPLLCCAQDRSKPVIFSMARLDRVKNLTGLAEWYGRNKRLRSLANLVIVGGIVDPALTKARASSGPRVSCRLSRKAVIPADQPEAAGTGVVLPSFLGKWAPV